MLPGAVKAGLKQVKHLYHRVFSSLPIPAILPYGGLMLTWNDYNGDSVFSGGETEEAYRFVESYLRPGMTALDIGAHQGFYAILASKRVAPHGRVVAFEPSPRETRQLRINLRANGCANVKVEPYAIANYDGNGILYVVADHNTGCNSLRPPNISEPVEELAVPVVSLDSYLSRNSMSPVHLMKIDAEGAELEILKGASSVLAKRPRPVVLCEVADVRTAAWDYRSRDILEFIGSRGYLWFRVKANGALEALTIAANPQGTFVAIPEELIR